MNRIRMRHVESLFEEAIEFKFASTGVPSGPGFKIPDSDELCRDLES